MTYQGRVGTVGIYDKKPFAGFVLASRSDSDRLLRVNEEKKRVEIYGVGDLANAVRESAEFPFDAADNLYACLIGFHDSVERPAVVSFNGRMSNRIKDMVKHGCTPQKSLRQTLEVFPPILKNDPRIGAVIGLYNSGTPYFYFGTYHASDTKPEITKLENIANNEFAYVTLTDCKQVKRACLDGSVYLEELAQQLFKKILGNPAESGIGAAVCMIDGNDLKFGVYNQEAKND